MFIKYWLIASQAKLMSGWASPLLSCGYHKMLFVKVLIIYFREFLFSVYFRELLFLMIE